MNSPSSDFCSVLQSTGHGENSLQLAGRVTDFSCPKCPARSLEVGRLGNKVEVCFCPQCQGFVIDSATLGSLVSALRAEYRGADDRPELLNERDLSKQICCPACNEIMDVHSYCGPGNVVLDSCRHCKLVWFNQGELNRIIRAPGRR